MQTGCVIIQREHTLPYILNIYMRLLSMTGLQLVARAAFILLSPLRLR